MEITLSRAEPGNLHVHANILGGMWLIGLEKTNCPFFFAIAIQIFSF